MGELAVILLFGLLAFLMSRGVGFVAWLRRELQLARAETWAQQPQIAAGVLTVREDPRCRQMVIRQRSKGVYLRREGVKPRVRISAAWEHRADAFRFPRAADGSR